MSWRVAAAVIVGSLATAALVKAACGTRRRKQPQRVVVTQLFVFPVKGCSGYSPASISLTPHGVQYDREWTVIRPSDNAVLTQRELPRMRLITATIDELSQHLVLNAPEMPTLRLPLAAAPAVVPTATFKVTLWNISGEVADQGADAAAWFSSFLGVDCRLARMHQLRQPKSSFKHAPIAQETDRVMMQDFSTLHIISEEGLDWCRKAAADPTVDALRFRPNIVVRGVAFPEEDRWLNFTVSGIPMRTAKHCGRCSVPTILPDASRDEDYKPTAVLKKTRNAYYIHQRPMDFEGRQKWPMFGLNVFHDSCGTVSVGGEVLVTGERSDSLEFDGAAA